MTLGCILVFFQLSEESHSSHPFFHQHLLKTVTQSLFLSTYDTPVIIQAEVLEV